MYLGYKFQDAELENSIPHEQVSRGNTECRAGGIFSAGKDTCKWECGTGIEEMMKSGDLSDVVREVWLDAAEAFVLK